MKSNIQLYREWRNDDDPALRCDDTGQIYRMSDNEELLYLLYETEGLEAVLAKLEERRYGIRLDWR